MTQSTTDEMTRHQREDDKRSSAPRDDARRRTKRLRVMVLEMMARRERWRKKNGWADQ